MIALSLAPPALAGYALERPIERRLGGPRSIAAGLIAGALAMALADCSRAQEHVEPADGLSGKMPSDPAAPGSATRGAADGWARARHRPGRGADPGGVAQRRDAHGRASAGIRPRGRRGALLARGLPVILGASALKAWRLWRSGRRSPTERTGARGGAGSAFVSTAASARRAASPAAERASAAAICPLSLHNAAIAS